jgi:hypothetical protein
LTLFALISGIQAQKKITVDVSKPGHTISQTLFGFFYKDINLSTDGGIYQEFVHNGSFKDADTFEIYLHKGSNGEFTLYNDKNVNYNFEKKRSYLFCSDLQPWKKTP